MENKKMKRNGDVNKVQTATNDGFNFGSTTKEIGGKPSASSGNFDVSNKRLMTKMQKSTHNGSAYLKKTTYRYSKGGAYRDGEDVITYKKPGSGGFRAVGHAMYDTYAMAWDAGTKGVITEIHTDDFLGARLSAVLAETQTYTLKTGISMTKYHGNGSDIVE